MAVVLTSYPVTSTSGKVRNIFAGFDSVELEFKREDSAIIDVAQGVDNKLLITVLGDLTTDLNVGEWVYINSPGATLTYSGSFQILTVVFSSPNTEITVNTDFIEVAALGYLNYKQNWFLEAKLVDPNNNLVLKYPQLLQNDGSPEGIIEVNTSMLVDFLKNEILETSQEVTGARNNCKVMFRESWREDDTQAFALVDDFQIIIIYAAENSEIQSFVNGFNEPRMWEGYPFYLNMLSSVENMAGKRAIVTFNELDINNDNIIIDNPLANFESSDFGLLQSNFNDNIKVIEANTRYITFNANDSGSADFETVDFNDTDFLTINTP